jgi:hypothetical protein
MSISLAGRIGGKDVIECGAWGLRRRGRLGYVPIPGQRRRQGTRSGARPVISHAFHASWFYSAELADAGSSPTAGVDRSSCWQQALH